MITTTLTTADQQPLMVRQWRADHPIATVQVLHGMAEHCERYDRFATFLQQKGYSVIAHNHRGHGERTPIGHYADENGWNKVLDDVSCAQALAEPELPLFLFGHSMGSFIARAWTARHGSRLRGLVLSGSNHQSPLLFTLGRTVAGLLKPAQGGQHLSGLMNTLSFSSFNRAFEPAVTPFDWLSRDTEQVQRYLHDPHCGHLCSLQLWLDLFAGLIEIANPKSSRAIPQELPILLFGGDRDPVGRMGKGIPALAELLRQTGHDKVTSRLYPEGRHEMLNELNADDVFNDVLEWLNQQLPAR